MLSLRIKGSATALAKTPRITKRTNDQAVPLSLSQHQMWVIDQMNPGNPAYNMPVAYRLSGQLDVRALEEGFNAIIQRHEVWRTTFRECEGNAIQEIHAECEIKIGITDLSHLPEVERESQASALASREAGRPFDLRQLPLIRVSLFRLDENDHVLLLNLHHIVGDGLSLNLIFDELDAIYRATIIGEAPRLPDLMIQYADFAVWQRENIAASRYLDQVNYWQQKLTGNLPVLEFGTEKQRPLRQSFKGANVNFLIPKDLARALNSIGKQADCTFFVTVLAAFQVILLRYSQAEEVVIGTPVANRSVRDVDRLIGNFINIVALRCDLSGNPTFVELLQRSREMTLDGLSNSEIPFEEVVKALTSPRDSSRNPVFQVLLQILPPVRAKIGELSVAAFNVDLNFAQMDLVLSLYEETDGSFIGRFQYCADIFADQTIERLALNFVQLLNEIVENPRRKVAEIRLLSEPERKQLVRGWNDSDRDYPSETTIHALVERQANVTPDSGALEFDNLCLTYRELNRRSNQLARRLRDIGVGPGALVGISVENPVQMIIGLLATLKAGGAYVPLDPDYPKDRLAFMLEDSAVPVLLTELKLSASLPPHQAKTIYLDSEQEEMTIEYDCAPGVSATASDLAYVIYTSGSTGRPKGVEVAQRGLCNLIDWQTRTFRVDEKSRVLQFASFSFDASVWEVFMALTKGATLVLRSRKAGTSSTEFAEFLRRTGVTHATLPPSFLAILSSEDLPELQTVISAGEACSAELARRWSRGRQFFNAYGPTEATVCASSYLCGDESKAPPIGRPIQNTQLYILDRNLQLLPAGLPGELHIGGVGLARGYLNRPELTKEKFIPNPFAQESGARLYKTGDLCRFLPDGNIEYLGRMDNQVKIRGFRIELGEIESLLRQDPAISDAVVIAKGDTSGDMRLIAYLVPAQPALPAITLLRSHLKTRVPDYMVPAEFVFVDEIPLSANGKVDHRALPEPAGQGVSAREYTAAQNPVEGQLVQIWEDLLKRQPIGIHDDFFELGGHSLAAMQVVSRVRQSMRADLSLARFFASPTIAEIASAITDCALNAPGGHEKREEGVL